MVGEDDQMIRNICPHDNCHVLQFIPLHQISKMVNFTELLGTKLSEEWIIAGLSPVILVEFHFS